MPKGIYIRTKEHGRNLSKAKKGITKEINPNLAHSKETKRRMSKIMMGNQNPLGNTHSKETRRKMSKSAMGHIVSKVARRKISKARKGVTKEINSNLIRSEEYKRKKSRAQQEKWNDIKYKKKQLKAICASRILRILPNKPERRLRNGLNKMFPGEYKYVGDGSVIIGYKNPDFVNVNGQKKIIELFGNYWHSKEVTGRTRKQEKIIRIEHFAKYGYKTLIVWEYELKNIRRLREKLERFHSG